MLGTPSVEPGGLVRGRVRVLDDERPRRLIVRAIYRERTPNRSGIGRTVEGPVLGEADLAAGTEHEFTIQLPVDALPGCESAHGRLSWAVEVQSDRPGLDTVEYAEFQVRVRG